ncbi:hypothetical protein [Spirosoma sp. 209]|uniref:hypothetical protein n=1 Tax=Spirosoma sp. 209 TaxID=1955701 RepID=UPI00098D21D1|nr:hypothetical protein [Spirosoma sp. 209]
MKTTTKKYSTEAKQLLYGQIKGSRYTQEVRTVLLEQGIVYDPGYIRLVVTSPEADYNEVIWDAVKQVVKNRKVNHDLQAATTQEVRQLIGA